VTAAALPEVACTVWSNLVMVARMKQGETLLVHGGAGGIGTFAIQLAHHRGVRVVTTAGSPEKLETCRSLGADVVVSYRDEDFVEVVKGLGGADFTSSRSWRTMLPIRITLAGCSTRSLVARSPSPSSSAPWSPLAPVARAAADTVPTGRPSGPTTTTCCSPPASPAGSSGPGRPGVGCAACGCWPCCSLIPPA